MVKEFSEKTLIESFKRGEPGALDYYFRLHFRALIYFSQRITSDIHESEDIVADIFAKLWKMRVNFNSSARIKAFLYISVRNASLNYRAYLKRQSAICNDLQYILDDIEEAHECTAFEIEVTVLQQVHDEIEKLPRRCKQIFKLIYFGGMNNDEIADKLQLSPYTVANQKQRALGILRTSFIKRKSMNVPAKQATALFTSLLMLTFLEVKN